MGKIKHVYQYTSNAWKFSPDLAMTRNDLKAELLKVTVSSLSHVQKLSVIF